MKTFYRVERSMADISSFAGEAGDGIYATPNFNVLDYYKKTTQSFRVLKFKPKTTATIINLDKIRGELINFIQNEIKELVKKYPHHIPSKINVSNYHRWPHSINIFVQKFNCSGYVIQHKHPSLPTGKQIVILKLEDFEVSVLTS